MDSFPHPSGTPKILIVEDEAIVWLSVQMQLSRAGFEVKVCQDGAEAVEYLGANSVDLILSDLVMEGLSGPDLIRELGRACSTAAIIILTGHPLATEELSELRVNVADVVLKPVGEELVETVKRVLDV